MGLIDFHLTHVLTGKWLEKPLKVFSRRPPRYLSSLSVINDLREPIVSEKRESEIISYSKESVAFYTPYPGICVQRFQKCLL